MLQDLLLFLSLLNISSAKFKHNKKKEVVLYLDNKQMDQINYHLKDDCVRQVMTQYVQSLEIDATTGDYKLVIIYK